MQLAEAQVNLRNSEQRIRDKELELARSKDENRTVSIQLAKLVEGNRNLSTLLAKFKLETKNVSTRLLTKTTALSVAKAERDKTVTTLNNTINEQKRKIAAQKTNIQGLENQNARLKDKAVGTPPQPKMGRKKQGNAGLVRSGRGERQTGLIRRGDSMERDGKGDEATTPKTEM
jgi:chromosome segregation ATPase